MGDDRRGEEMTAKERARIAMEGGKPDGLPTMEIVFELERELTGRARCVSETGIGIRRRYAMLYAGRDGKIRRLVDTGFLFFGGSCGIFPKGRDI